jgi:hypothetical protein
MDTDQAFAVDANIEAIASASASLSYRGHDTVKAAGGGLDILDDPRYERSPLLTLNPEEIISTEEANGDDWIGDGDLIQRPWWNRPSVSRVHHLRGVS